MNLKPLSSSTKRFLLFPLKACFHQPYWLGHVILRVWFVAAPIWRSEVSNHHAKLSAIYLVFYHSLLLPVTISARDSRNLIVI